MAKLVRSSYHKLSGAANPNFGKAWGNALGGYKSQPRVAGRFATSSQVKAYAKIKAKGAKRPLTPKGAHSKMHSRSIRPREIRPNKDTTVSAATMKAIKGLKNPSLKTKGVMGGVGAAVSAALLAKSLNPKISVGRKRLSFSIRPEWKLGPLHAFTRHEVGIERQGDDIIDMGIKKSKDFASQRVAEAMGGSKAGKTASSLFDSAIGKTNEVTIGGQKINVDGSGLSRRWRYDLGQNLKEKGNHSVPGAPPAKRGKATKPQGTRKGGAKTVTNTTKGGSGQVKLNSRPQRRGGGKKKKKSKKGTYTK